ncbi:MAG: universal stress protein [Burkholderiaceae bacterium]|jgi:nucleotide-binding universal stress UspA family protein|nr:universal stress protein [Burkholderiaceae bacterium]HMN64752.1 universal stress protein [Burkholderiaceae bacterium]
MKMLVATDGSKNALHAVKYAIQLLGRMSEGGSITLISVHDDVALRHARRFVGKEAVADYLRELSEQDLADSRKALDKAGVSHDMIIRTGHVATEIVEAAERGKFDLLVMGSKGRSALKDLLIGSVAKRVAEISRVPVLLVR